MVYFAGCSFQCCAEQKVLPGCKVFLKHCQKVPDEDETFVHRYSKICTALSSICVILLSLARMWFHVIAKKLASKSEWGGWTGILPFFLSKNDSETLLLARALSFFRVYPEGIQATVSWMHFSCYAWEWELWMCEKANQQILQITRFNPSALSAAG